jgi:hypothetical protein
MCANYFPFASGGQRLSELPLMAREYVVTGVDERLLSGWLRGCAMGWFTSPQFLTILKPRSLPGQLGIFCVEEWRRVKAVRSRQTGGAVPR